MNEYLVTFKSTTAALKAKRLVDDDSVQLEEVIRDTAEVIPVPFSLSSTCFGLGLKCSASENGIKEMYRALVEQQVDFKNFWLTGKEYTPCLQQVERM